ncbi:glycosyl hydrolase family 2 [Christiangramia gaetbulicola]|uniref:Glycosyl hydrolase family 2 n=1 Tax=Christiangramia gaetbulicola TaxID=703340 RepID=A0A2T6ADX5_9FLAO|nr:glycoside hydrolase family 2 TIM barrel-domain containing protein [Christiangramia gaetbulicola]PTX42011.1 glycosyl hydrolase family 2 [Christiangramia gaetbulicola]
MGAFLFIAFTCDEEKYANHPAKVHFEKTEDGYSLIRNGNPFYIKGAGTKPEYLEELKDAGANTARIYDTLYLKRTLDKAHSLGLAVAVDIPLPKFDRTPEYWENEELFTELKLKVEEIVQRHKDHPALLYWNLGNELYYPYLYETTDFFDNYNQLIDLIHEIDSEHPVSTTTIGANKSRVLSIITKSPQLDFISFNSFGVLSQFSSKLDPISPIWDGPYVISEWGVNGPWEATHTYWGAPVEETSTKKAEQIRERYFEYLEPKIGKGSLGSFVFYWATKNEFTPTWYSLFGKNKLKTQAIFELNNIWKNKDEKFPGPELDYILLNKQGAKESIVLSPGTLVQAEVKLPDSKAQKLNYHWEIRPESWYDVRESNISTEIDFKIDGQEVSFKTPKDEGPYRLFLYLTDDSEYYATANIPFYVLKPYNEE